MKHDHTLTINMDPCNPGQYFACCGVLAVVDRLSSHVRAWFDCPDETPRKGRFRISTCEPLGDQLLRVFDGATVSDDPLFGDAHRNPVVIVTKSAGSFYLDWWLNNDYRNFNGRLKNWASAVKIKENRFENWIRDMKEEAGKGISMENIFDRSRSGKKINIDPRSAFNGSLSLGYSPRDMRFDTAVYPYVEFYGAVGLQSNRPETKKKGIFSYYIWEEPIPFELAAITTGNQSQLGTRCFFFQQVKLKNKELGHNTPFNFAQPDVYGNGSSHKILKKRGDYA
ncbi:MAG: hypothetical protein GY846_01800 [Deltaproteobacteria bacterium]|nr:hypothetical protein [Deltaproteobacteria bacterium]